MQVRDENQTVSAAELVRSFAACRDRAVTSPLFIANHGRKSHVLIGVDQYDELLAAGRQSAGTEQSDELRELADWMDEAVIITDRYLRITFANRVAHAVCHKPPTSLNNRPFIEALPEIAGTLLEVHVRHTVVSSELSAADLPSPFAQNAWLRFQTFPVGDRIVMVFRDITEDVQRHRMDDLRSALLLATDAHGGIGFIRVSLRATIDNVAKQFCTMLGLPEDRLMELPVIDLVTTASRPDFRAALDAVIRGKSARQLRSSFVSNTGGSIEMMASMAPLHGAYGVEGAVILTTPLAIA
jgi:PAS domain-containing protein